MVDESKRTVPVVWQVSRGSIFFMYSRTKVRTYLELLLSPDPLGHPATSVSAYQNR